MTPHSPASRESDPVPEAMPLTRTQFIVAMAIEIGRFGDLPPGTALPRASAAYREFEADNGVEFGHPSFAWNEDAARIVAREYDTDHWEAA